MIINKYTLEVIPDAVFVDESETDPKFCRYKADVVFKKIAKLSKYRDRLFGSRLKSLKKQNYVQHDFIDLKIQQINKDMDYLFDEAEEWEDKEFKALFAACVKASGKINNPKQPQKDYYLKMQLYGRYLKELGLEKLSNQFIKE